MPDKKVSVNQIMDDIGDTLSEKYNLECCDYSYYSGRIFIEIGGKEFTIQVSEKEEM